MPSTPHIRHPHLFALVAHYADFWTVGDHAVCYRYQDYYFAQLIHIGHRTLEFRRCEPTIVFDSIVRLVRSGPTQPYTFLTDHDGVTFDQPFFCYRRHDPTTLYREHP